MRRRIRIGRMLRQYAHRRINFRALWLFLICLFAAVTFFSLELKLRPIVRAYAEGRARYVAIKVINEAVQEELETQDIYDSLLHLEKGSDGNVIALKTEPVKMNRLKSAIISRIGEKLNASGSVEIRIPIGNMINGELFSGRGPRISVLLQMVNNVNAVFVSEFEHAGINQTMHRILIDVTVGMNVILPGGSSYFEITTEMSIAETIIVGDVPETYTDIVDTREGLIEKYNDYGS